MAERHPKKFAALRRSVDFGKTAGEYATHRAGFPPAFFARLAEHGIGGAGQAILDIGTGTGSLARGLALGGAAVTGLDPSPAMLAEARRLAAEASLAIAHVQGRAEALGFAGASFDAITAGQCWHWLERPRAAGEALRVLVPGGRLAIAHYDWIALPGNIAALTEALIQAHNPDWRLAGGRGIYAPWLTDLGTVGFVGLETFSFDHDTPYTRQSWRGRLQACAGIGASLSPQKCRAFDRDLAAVLAEHVAGEAFTVLHRVWAVIGLKPA